MVKSIEKESRGVGARGCGGNGEFVFHGDRGSVWDNEKVLEMDSGCTTT